MTHYHSVDLTVLASFKLLLCQLLSVSIAHTQCFSPDSRWHAVLLQGLMGYSPWAADLSVTFEEPVVGCCCLVTVAMHQLPISDLIVSSSIPPLVLTLTLFLLLGSKNNYLSFVLDWKGKLWRLFSPLRLSPPPCFYHPHLLYSGTCPSQYTLSSAYTISKQRRTEKHCQSVAWTQIHSISVFLILISSGTPAKRGCYLMMMMMMIH